MTSSPTGSSTSSSRARLGSDSLGSSHLLVEIMSVMNFHDIMARPRRPVPPTLSPPPSPWPPSQSVPGAPTIGAAIAGNASASVAFTAQASDGGGSISGYTVTAVDATTPEDGGQTAGGTTSPITVPGLTNGDRYTFTVTATNAAGTGPASAASSPVVPQAGQAIVFTSTPGGTAVNYGQPIAMTVRSTRGGRGWPSRPPARGSEWTLTSRHARFKQ
jgi:Fibronectin type III domain